MRRHGFPLIPGLVALLVLTAGVAGARGVALLTAAPEDEVTVEEQQECPPADDEGVSENTDSEDPGEGTEESEPGDEESEPGDEECEPADEGEESEEDADGEAQESDAEDPEALRAAECMTAAGMEPAEDGDTEDGDTEDGDTEKLTGLDNAIARVLENCIKNPQAPGLLNALQHLNLNKERHEAHELAKAERKAAREEAKAARAEAKAASGGGPPGSEGGPGNGHGKAKGHSK